MPHQQVLRYYGGHMIEHSNHQVFTIKIQFQQHTQQQVSPHLQLLILKQVIGEVQVVILIHIHFQVPHQH